MLQGNLVTLLKIFWEVEIFDVKVGDEISDSGNLILEISRICIPSKINMAPENRPSQSIFQGLC